jgi:hypothetical protein
MKPFHCPYCGMLADVVHVHGHGQCSRCGTNVEPCCSGASPEEPAAAGAIAILPDPTVLERVFQTLGNATATHSETALRHALVQRLACDLDYAGLVLQAAVKLGLLDAHAGGFRLPRSKVE